MTVSVSSGGRSPALSSWLRDTLAVQCEGVGALAELLGEVRARLLRAGVPSDSVNWRQLLDGPLPELVRAGDLDDARAIVDDLTHE